MSFKTFILEHIIPNISAVIALIFLIRYIWTSNKDDSGNHSIFRLDTHVP